MIAPTGLFRLNGLIHVDQDDKRYILIKIKITDLVKFLLRKSEVVRFAHSEVLLLRRKVKLSLPHFAVRRNFTHAVNFTAEGNFTCPQGQT